MRFSQVSFVVMVPIVLILGVMGSAHAGEPVTWTPPEPVVATAAGDTPSSVATPSNPASIVQPAADEPPVLAVLGPKPPPPVKSTRRKAKRCGKGSKPCARVPSPSEAELRRRTAVAMRVEILAVAESMVKAGRPGAAAAALGGAAEAHADPVLHLAAVEVELAEPKLSAERLRSAVARTQTARKLIEQPGEAGILVGEGPALLEQSDALAAYGERRLAGLRLTRRGRAQVIGGAVLLTASLGGVAALASGAALGGRIDTAVAKYAGTDAAYLDALGAAREQANLRMAAGAVVGLLGAAAGIPLSISGARDLQAARGTRKERPALRIAPGFAALTLTGRF